MNLVQAIYHNPLWGFAQDNPICDLSPDLGYTVLFKAVSFLIRTGIAPSSAPVSHLVRKKSLCSSPFNVISL